MLKPPYKQRDESIKNDDCNLSEFKKVHTFEK